MKSFILKTVVLSTLIFNFSAYFLAHAERAEASGADAVGINEVMASQYARWMAQIPEGGSLTAVLPMSGKDAQIVNAEVKKSKDDFSQLKVSMVMPTKIEIQSGSDKVYISYRQFDKGFLYINEKPVKFENHKTFHNYRAEVDAILAQESAGIFKRFSLVSEAYAQKKNTLRNAVATVGVSNAVVYRGFGQKYVEVQHKSQLDKLADVLIQAFKNESDRSKKLDREYKRPAFFTAFTFTCEGKFLSSVAEKMLVAKGKIDGTSMDRLTKVGSDYRYTDRQCNFLVDKDGKVKKGQKLREYCGAANSVFTSSPFFGFPLAAAQCCSVNGCYEKVKAATAAFINTHVEGVGKSLGKKVKSIQ